MISPSVGEGLLLGMLLGAPLGWFIRGWQLRRAYRKRHG